MYAIKIGPYPFRMYSCTYRGRKEQEGYYADQDKINKFRMMVQARSEPAPYDQMLVRRPFNIQREIMPRPLTKEDNDNEDRLNVMIGDLTFGFVKNSQMELKMRIHDDISSVIWRFVKWEYSSFGAKFVWISEAITPITSEDEEEDD